jgi:hypothetical protein
MDRVERAPRYAVHIPFRATHPLEGSFRGGTINVSESGFLFATHVYLDVGHLMVVELCMDRFPDVKCEVEIVRTCSDVKGAFKYGARIVKMGKADRQLLADLLSNHQPDGEYIGAALSVAR